MGGGTATVECVMVNPDGQSPRGRGNRWRRVVSSADLRSIPAWAGEPIRPRAHVHGVNVSVYPRVGGGTARHWANHLLRLHGLSPRGRGNPGAMV